MKRLLPLFLGLCALAAQAAPIPLFDGKTLDGWEGNPAVWRVQDGVIMGGSMNGNPRNEFLAARRSYRNFSFKADYKLVGTEGFVNSGVQFRSKRLTQPAYEMFGYQADIGATYSGCLYDESRRKKVLVQADKALIARIEKPGDWNTYEIRAEGPHIQLFLNGELTVDYTETEPGIEEEGLIALQIHGNNKAEVSFRNISVEDLDPNAIPGQAAIFKRLESARPAAPLPAGPGIGASETIVLTGQSNFVRKQKSAALEARLAVAFAKNAPRFRSMAYDGDTVYEQWRDLNFGSWTGQLEATGATMVLAQFGQIEALDGPSRLPQFSAAYEHLLDQFAARTARIVLVSPMPFEKPRVPRLPDLTPRNEDVRAYSEAIRAIAKRRGLPFIDLLTPLLARAVSSSVPLTDNGMHLNEPGLNAVAEIIAQNLGAQPSTLPPELRAAIVEKNRLWMDCWRPANWSFVYGDRTAQLFGKPAGDAPSLRGAFEAHQPLIAALDARIHALASGETPAPIAPPPVPPARPEIPQLSPEAEQATFTLADGYQINLFASERDGIVKPTQMVWDEKGRLIVACSPTYPHMVPGAKPGDFIMICEDTDGDGRADKFTRFAEGLTMVQGVEPGDGGLYVCDFDQLLHLRDTDGDGRADSQRVVFSGFGTGDTHQLINSITHGPDGKLWFTQGLHAFSRVETPWGLARLDKSGVFRLNPRTLQLEGFFNGGKAGHNCWGVAFDDFNQVFHKSGDRPDGYYSLPGLGRYPDPEEYHPIGALFKTNPKTTALDIIGTRALPADIQGCALIGGYFGSVVELHRFLDDGAGFKSEQLPKLLTSSTTSFRPVDVSVGPDGAMYLADWFNPVIGHYQASYQDPSRDKTHGRIWRISAKGFAPVKQPDLASMTPAALLEQLHSPERWTRYQAARLLFDAPTAEVEKAIDPWIAAQNPEAPDTGRALLMGTGILSAHDLARPALLSRLLADNDPRVRAGATRFLPEWAPRLPDPMSLLQQSARDEHPRVRLEAIVAASYFANPEAAAIAARTLELPTDRFLDYARRQTVLSLRPQWLPALQTGRLPAAGDAALEYLQKMAAAAPATPNAGRKVYDALCLNCHQPDGKGLPGVYPPLAGSQWVAGSKPALIKMLLHGLGGPIDVAGQPFGIANPLPMPPSGLDDQQIADVLTEVRATFGSGASPVTPAEVSALRAQFKDRATVWTPAEF